MPDDLNPVSPDPFLQINPTFSEGRHNARSKWKLIALLSLLFLGGITFLSYFYFIRPIEQSPIVQKSIPESIPASNYVSIPPQSATTAAIQLSPPVKKNDTFFVRLPENGTWSLFDDNGSEINLMYIPNVGNSGLLKVQNFTITGKDMELGKMDITVYDDGRYANIKWDNEAPNSTISVRFSDVLEKIQLIDSNKINALSFESDFEYSDSSHVAGVSISNGIEDNLVTFSFDGNGIRLEPTSNLLTYQAYFTTEIETRPITMDSVFKTDEKIHVLTPIDWKNLSLGIETKAISK